MVNLTLISTEPNYFRSHIKLARKVKRFGLYTNNELRQFDVLSVMQKNINRKYCHGQACSSLA